MAKYKLDRAVLGEVEGQGYAFTRKTVFGKTYQGVFFAENESALEDLNGEEEITFSGPVYHRRRDRSARKKEEELTVSIVNSTSTPMGERAEFEAVENP